MEPFVHHRGLVATLNRANVDTDQIIPKQFLKSIRRTGFEEGLFFDWRFQADGTPDPAFELNAPRFKGATILVTRNNFGCGSSREHAVWAIQQYGFRAVLAPRVERDGDVVPAFADIFRNNAAKNGLLTVELTEAEVDEIFALAAAQEGLEATVDLRDTRVSVHASEPRAYAFEIDPGVRTALMEGLDEIEATLKLDDVISAFEAGHDTQRVAG